MKYYISESDEIFAYESDGSQDAFIKEGLILLSDEELAAIRERQAAEMAPEPEQALQTAYSERDRLLALAAIRIAPLQDAVDLDEATTSETNALKQWKQYRIAVNRVSSQPGFPSTIIWPAQPA